MAYTSIRDALKDIPGVMNNEFLFNLKPEERVFTVEKMEKRELEYQGSKESKPCLYFVETALYLPMGPQLLNQLAANFGDAVPVGQKVQVSVNAKGHREISRPSS